MLELHCHTTFSDGTLTPTQLVQTAVESGLQALAITDHDTLSGWDEAIAAAQPYGLEIVPGIELSTVWSAGANSLRSLHVLGFYPDPTRLNPPLVERLAGRKRRAEAILSRLAAMGYPLHLPKLDDRTAPGRPHIALAMVQAGYVRTAQEAFERFLGDDRPAYVPYETLLATDGIALLRRCGAVPVWAHPYLFRGGEVEDVLPSLIEAGLMGLEVYHPSHSPSQIDRLKILAHQHGLLVTGGSDYHGPDPASTSKHALALNQFRLPLSLLEPIQQRASALLN